jgi:hypothetical protein
MSKFELPSQQTDKTLTSHHGPGTLPEGRHHGLPGSEVNAPWVPGALLLALGTSGGPEEASLAPKWLRNTWVLLGRKETMKTHQPLIA